MRLKFFFLHALGTIGRGCAVETSHRSVYVESGTGKPCRISPVMAVRVAYTSASVSCAYASTSQSVWQDCRTDSFKDEVVKDCCPIGCNETFS